MALFLRDGGSILPTRWLYSSVTVALKLREGWLFHPKFVTKQYSRDPYISELAKRLANGKCELCGKPAPFKDSKGKPYLETHHVVWLSQGGSDSVDNTVALCPNCHRKMHVVADPGDVSKLKIVAKKNAL